MRNKLLVALLASLVAMLVFAASGQADPITADGLTGDLIGSGLAPTGFSPAEATGCVDNTSGWLGKGQSISTTDGQTHWAGVIYVHIPPSDPAKIPTFCTDLGTSIGKGYCFVADGPTACPITWLLNNGYGPGNLNPDTNAEAAARQAAIWYFSDGLIVRSTDPVYARTQQIIAAVPNPCVLPQSAPVMTLDPPSDVNFLPGGETHAMTVTVTQDGNPVAGQTVNLSTTFGTLSHSSVTTGNDGKASFTLTSNTTGSATVTASFSYTLPAGTRMVKLPGNPDQQVLVLGTPQTGNVIATATKTWHQGTKIIVHKFSDNNTNGVQDGGEESLSGWTMKLYRWSGSSWDLVGTKSTNTIGDAVFDNLSPGEYRAEETLQSGWLNTTPNPSASVTLPAGGQAVINFGNVALAVIRAWKFYDLDADGERDASEPVLDGWEMNISPAVNGIGSGLTSGGSYSFINLPPNTYRVWETQRSDWVATTDSTRSVTVAANAFVNLWFGNVQMDLGDLPEEITGHPSYATTTSRNGARHTLDGRYLGAVVDAERDGCPCSCCGGDDANRTVDDEDGVVFSSMSNWAEGRGVVDVTVGGGAGCLNAWLDFTNDAGGGVGLNFRDGDFNDSYQGVSEWIIQNRQLEVGTTSISFTVPPGFLGNEARTYFFRFRFTPRDADGGCARAEAYVTRGVALASLLPGDQTGGGASPLGLAIGGEVEDYRLDLSPLAVTLASFAVEATPDGVALTWETVSETDNAGFNIYRADSEAGPWTRLNTTLIPAAAPGSAQGALYTWTDTAAMSGLTYWYMLEDVALNGATTRHAPVVVTVVAPNALQVTNLAAASGSVQAVPLVTLVSALVSGFVLARRRRR